MAPTKQLIFKLLQTNKMSKIWYVTGASKGLGLALVKKLIEKGHRVAATTRQSTGELIDAVGTDDISKFLPLVADLTSEESVKDSIVRTHNHFGGLDVVVNNAGYGLSGSIEELSMEEMTNHMDINVLATFRVIHHAMPFLRKQRSGNIINISSIGGFAGPLGWPLYAASKFAIFGYTDVLAQDVKEFGVKVTVVAPGRFKTSFLDDSMNEAKHRIEDYTAVNELQKKIKSSNGMQTGDPEKAAQAMLDLTELSDPPVILFLGPDAYYRATKRLEELHNSLEKNKDVTVSTDL